MKTATSPATKGQTFAIFCLAKYDVRNCDLTFEQASYIIDQLKKGQADVALAALAELPNAVKKGESPAPKKDWQAVYNEAHESGTIAGTMALCEPMVVVGHANPADDSSPVKQRWVVPEGPCGFAWITIHPGTCSFAKWATKKGLASPHYGGGVSIWVHDFNQSITRKEAYARAFASVLTTHGITAYAGSRLD